MKKTFVVVVLAIVLALSFATIATAKYAGYAYNTPLPGNADKPTIDPNPFPGYLSWSGANSIWRANTGAAEDASQATAHGGYVTTTTKCAVCHSAHRAYASGASTLVSPNANRSLTIGATCEHCHTNFGAGGANKKIEWAESSPGPHASEHNFPNGCSSSCHTGGIHGRSVSAYNGMNAFMLGGDKDAALTDAFERGNVRTGTLEYNSPTTGGEGWFQNGTTGTPTNMDTPADVNANQFSAAKSMATGYTCGQDGCHTSGQFANNVWGFSSMRAGDPSKSDDLNTAMTGHLTAFPRNYGRSYSQCGPCHPGAPAGGYRVAGNIGEDGVDPAIFSARQYGCDQCHDMVGRATNTTAWPHGNRNIDVYEWTAVNGNAAEATRTVLPNISSGNLWMYQSSLAVEGEPNTTKYPADGTFKLIQNAIGHKDADSGEFTPGIINDGACLKCHVAVDQASIAANPGIDASKGVTIATEHAHMLYVDGDGVLRNNDGSVFSPDGGKTYTGTSTQIFLWK